MAEEARSNLLLKTYEEILLRLDVKSLTRFKCVCSCWYYLISSSSFVRRHLELSKSNPEQNHHRLFVIFPLTTIEYRYFGFHVEGTWNKIIDQPLRYPRGASTNFMEIVGSCDGLVCLLSGVEKKIIIIWNPSSKELVTFPFECDHFVDVGMYWFGHDTNRDNGYKLLVSRHYKKYNILYELSLSSSSSSNQWRKYEDNVICLIRVFEKRGTFLHGKVHWPCLQNRILIISYDLSKAKFRATNAPKVIRGNDSCFTLGVLDGCLSAICKPHKNFEIWIMKEYGMENPWTKLMELEGFEADSKILRLLGTLRNGDLIVDLDQTKLQRYYFNSKTPRTVKTHDLQDEGPPSDVIAYVESLVSPISAIHFSPGLQRVREEPGLNSNK